MDWPATAWLADCCGISRCHCYIPQRSARGEIALGISYGGVDLQFDGGRIQDADSHLVCVSPWGCRVFLWLAPRRTKRNSGIVLDAGQRPEADPHSYESDLSLMALRNALSIVTYYQGHLEGLSWYWRDRRLIEAL